MHVYASQPPITQHTGQGAIEDMYHSGPTQYGLWGLDNGITTSSVKDKETEDQESKLVKT